MNKQLLASTLNSLEFYFRQDFSPASERGSKIRDRLNAGDLIVIRDALHEGFAQRMFTCLDQYADWKLYEGYTEHFQYHHHNIYDENLFPADLIRCRDVFGSPATKNFIQQLALRDCSGKVVLSASWYLPGDHSLPHNDFLGDEDQHRQVAFVWQLTRNWHSKWGGEFFWCRKNRYVTPSFNTLLLFNVSVDSMHFVTHVSPEAESKRLAISGWWTGKLAVEQKRIAPPQRDISEDSSLEFI